jgi:tetratricopeptide (TPR) repeat protein
MEIAIRGQAMAKLNRFDQAAAVFLDAFKAASFPELAMVMDRFKQSFGPNVAMAKVAEWAKTGGGDPLFYFLLGVLHREAQDYPKAIEALTQANALAAKPKDKAVVDLELGLAYYESRNFPEAEKAYLASLQASGDDPITLNNLAFMYIVDMDQPDKALPYAAKAAQKAPTSADILDTYGWALAKTGSYDQAEKILVRALQLSTSPTSAAYIRYHQGWVCEQAHRPEEAARYYRQVDEILTDPNDPLHKDVSEALKRVQQTPSTKP